MKKRLPMSLGGRNREKKRRRDKQPSPFERYKNVIYTLELEYINSF